MPFPHNRLSAIHHLESNLLAHFIHPAQPDGQTMLFEVERPNSELIFSMVAVTRFQIRGEPTVDTPDTPVESITLYDASEYDADRPQPILEVSPDTNQTNIADSLPGGIDILTSKIDARWDAEHADMSVPDTTTADHSGIAGNFGDRGDWLIKY